MNEDFVGSVIKQISSATTLDETVGVIQQGLMAVGLEMVCLQRQVHILRQLSEFYAPNVTTNIDSNISSDRAAGDGLTPSLRSAHVRRMALSLAQGGRRTLVIADVLKALIQEGVIFSVKRPASMVGTVLSGMPQFQRIAQGVFVWKKE